MSGFKQVTRAQARTHMARDERIALMERTVRTLETAGEFVEEISRLWKDAQHTFLTIGRYLVQARSTLKLSDRSSRSPLPGDTAVLSFQDFVENNLPFGYQVAYQLRMVAECVDSQRIRPEELPVSYATAYQFTTLSDEALALARQSEPPLLRPTVRRAEIVAFKRALARDRAFPPARPDGSEEDGSREAARESERHLARLRRRQAFLLARRDKILAELAEVEHDLALYGENTG